jgi:XTP/dITP diphosphohydrolase
MRSKEILLGTTNEAKVKQLRAALAPVGIAVRGVKDKSLLPHVEENGKTAEENARKKARAYAKALGEPVLSMDNALYLEGIPDGEQPGPRVRRMSGTSVRPTDEEALAYYVALVGRHGGEMRGHWKFAICVAAPDGRYEETTIISPRIFVSTPSPRRIPGYPLESIQIDPETGICIADMTSDEQDAFHVRTIGKPLQEFVKNISL